MRTASVNGHDLSFTRSGQGEPLLLIMGMSGTQHHWGDPFLDALRSAFDLVVFDHVGVGDSSPAPQGFALADLAEDAAGLLDAVGWADAHVVGISMGGMIAQELVLAHPEKVRTLTLGCTQAGGEGAQLTTPEVMQSLAEPMLARDRARSLRAAWEANVSERFAADDGNWETFRRIGDEHAVAVETIMAQMQAIGGFDASTRLGDVRVPTLVVHGTDDKMLPVANAKLIADRIEGARLEILDDVGHMFWVEEPERSARLVRELAGVPAG